MLFEINKCVHTNYFLFINWILLLSHVTSFGLLFMHLTCSVANTRVHQILHNRKIQKKKNYIIENNNKSMSNIEDT